LHFVDNLNPVLIHLGPLQIRWYGVMYALSFIIGYYLICYLAQKRGVPLDRETSESSLRIWSEVSCSAAAWATYFFITCLITYIVRRRL
jgi:prolipoprotein diacylglyceryltransferase